MPVITSVSRLLGVKMRKENDYPIMNMVEDWQRVETEKSKKDQLRAKNRPMTDSDLMRDYYENYVLSRI